MRLGRVCKRCEKRFIPVTKHSYVCEKCSQESHKRVSIAKKGVYQRGKH